MTVSSALIAAGGRATRAGLCVPKSLVELDTRPLLAHLVQSLTNAGVTEIVISHNRPDLNSAFDEVSALSGVTIVADERHNSTICVARQHVKLLPSRFLFVYGHTLFEPHVLEALVSGSREATAFPISSRQTPIPWGAEFLEPPFIVDRQHLISNSPESRNAYWQSKSPKGVVRCTTPSEPNSRDELRNYLRTWNLDMSIDRARSSLSAHPRAERVAS